MAVVSVLLITREPAGVSHRASLARGHDISESWLATDLCLITLARAYDPKRFRENFKLQATTGSFLGTLDAANEAKLDYPTSMAFARVPVSICDIIFISRIPRWMWVMGLGILLGALAGRGNSRITRQ
jgi:hypothetical protein